MSTPATARRPLLPPREPLTEERLRALFVPQETSARGLGERISRGWRITFNRLLRLGGVSDGNEMTLFTDGDEAFTAFLAAIDAAKSRVWLETYIFEPDRLGLLVLDALTRARQRGCDVALLFDAFGSPHLGHAHTKALEDTGASVRAFNPLLGRRGMPLWVRDHRKILVADDVGFSGGMNISEDYAGPRLGNGRFRDTMARVTGPAVHDLACVFANSWRLATGQRLDTTSVPTAKEPGAVLQVLSSSERRDRRHIQRAIRQTLTRSLSHCWVTTPYFVPPHLLMRALILAARRGVDVRVLTAGVSDVPIVRRASHHLYARLLKRGVRIFEMFGATLHAKTITIDGVYATVGTFNLDHWSWRRMLEVNVTAVDRTVATSLERQFERDLEQAREVQLPSWRRRGVFERFVDWLAYQILCL